MLKTFSLLLALAVFPAACASTKPATACETAAPPPVERVAAAAPGETPTCPYALDRPDLLCALVITGATTRVRPYSYGYQKDILQAACVEESDPPEVVAQKVQELWRRHEDQLICDNPQTIAQNGNLIKVGVDAKFDAFINDVLRWGVNLNRIDADGTTVLDFIQSQLTRFQGTSQERRLRRYYVRFREAGALHRSELP